MIRNHAKKIVISSTIFLLALTLAISLPMLHSEHEMANEIYPSVSLPESHLGKKVSLEQAMQMATFKVKTPKSLPTETDLLQVYISENGRHATVLYSNPTIKTITESVGSDMPKAQLKIFMEERKDNPIPSLEDGLPPLKIEIIDQGKVEQTKFVEQPLPKFSKVMINNVEGVLFTPDESKHIFISTLSWWEDGTLYSITADLPEPELIQIAESME